MITELRSIDEQSLDLAAKLIREGELVAFPTETVYGLGANAYDEKAIGKIYFVKGRPGNNPLIAHIHRMEQATELCHWTEQAQALAEAFWPGPLTMILKRKPVVPAAISAGLDSLALRMPSNEHARAFLKRVDLPVAAPSANRSGRPSPTRAQHVWDDLNGLIPLILDGGSSQVGLESTVIDLSGEQPTILRPGAVTPEQIALLLGSCALAPSLLRPLKRGEVARSPGMLHRHYAPKGRLTLVEGEEEAVAARICQLYDANPESRILALTPHVPLYGDRVVEDMGKDAAEAAHRLFYVLRKLDDEGVRQSYCECLPPTGLGLAVMNRLARAAQFDILKAGYT